jgi:hypothetical protein
MAVAFLKGCRAPGGLHGRPPCTFYRSKHELVFVFKVGTARHVNTFGLGETGRYRTNVWEYAGVNSFREGRLDDLELHPTVKPADLVADTIKDCSRRGAIIPQSWQNRAITRTDSSKRRNPSGACYPRRDVELEGG